MKLIDEVKILVVDDREDNLLSIETILEDKNYQIIKANSGLAALKILLNQEDFTLILMDVKMPGMSGIETAELIYQREKLKHIPIIFITAFDKDEEGMFEGYRMGAVDFIYKPINPQLLRYKVGVFIELFRQRNQLIDHQEQLRASNASLEQEVQERKLSEHKVQELNVQLVQRNLELNASNEELAQFAYVASHDLQEPLRKILLYGDMVKQKLYGQIDSDSDFRLDKIIYSASRMRDLIRGILQFSRSDYDAGSFQLVDLNQIVSQVLSDMEEEITEKQALVSVGQLPVIWGVPVQMSQLFQNLVNNAMKFGRNGHRIEVDIHGKLIEADELLELPDRKPETNYHQILVKDNGIGFKMEHANAIFGVFKRLHTYREYEGTGIGLSICKKIVDRHGGFIKAESQLNQGATFIITLPEVKTKALVAHQESEQL
ncbi:MAG: response regulator [Bacteroidetes bacterium]|nr:response regulator [Fibrella sp.]